MALCLAHKMRSCVSETVVLHARLPSVQCLSIDPALSESTSAVDVMATPMEVDIIASLQEEINSDFSLDIAPQVCVKTHSMSHPWRTVDRLHVMPFKIENVRLRCARTVIVLLHAHVNLEDVRRAISGNIIGVITVPCCNFGPGQSSIYDRRPDRIFADRHMLSEKNELRLWWLGNIETQAISSATEITKQS